ncbi:MAG: M28 family peptidase [Verrucomicrobia bacterium]|nr:MAG: M28 family peptidase [Verrucomicrobiota bacterium]
MKRSVLLPPALLCAFLPLLGGQAPWETPARSIAAERILAHTRVLASDEFEGRAPGSPGEEKSVAYLAEQFRSMGLQPGGSGGSWTQDVPIVGVTSDVALSLADSPGGGFRPLAFPADFVAWSPRLEPSVAAADSELVFVGHGVTAPEFQWDDFKGTDVRGKTLLILVNDPQVPDPRDPGKLDPRVFKGNAMTYYGRWSYKFEEAARRGAAAAIIIHETKAAAYPWFVVVNSWSRERFGLQGSTEPTVPLAGWMHLDQARRVLAANGSTYEKAVAAASRRDFRPIPLKQRVAFSSRQTVRPVRSRNVFAALPGSDRRLRDDWLIYTAHWDHLGRNPKLDGDGIFNGAADNAIGAAGLLEIARAFATAPVRPKRSVLFLSVTAEEQGLLGARYYASRPVHPLARTVANINIDGLNPWGRTSDLRQIGQGSSTLDEVLLATAKARGRTVLPDAHPERGTFYRSDHFEFMKQGVPAIYINPGGHFLGKPAGYGESKLAEYIDRDYHKPSDEVKPDWDLSGAVEDLQVLMETGWRVADAHRMPAWKPGSEFHRERP